LFALSLDTQMFGVLRFGCVPFVQAQPEICHGGAGSPVGQKRERIKAVHQVISKFCDKKKALVSATGFGGLLRFPPIGPMHRKFVVWLMSRVDPRARTLVVDGSRSMKFDKEDVSRVFGIPCEGKKVTQSSRHVIGEVMDGYLGKVMKDHRSIKAAQEVLEREHDGMMTVDEEKAFKAAFVIYVVSTLLAPGSKYDQTSFDYWDALVDPDAIGMYDWSDYVLCRLIDGVSKVKADLWGNGKVVKITGCTLFLQVPSCVPCLYSCWKKEKGNRLLFLTIFFNVVSIAYHMDEVIMLVLILFAGYYIV
jgi:hypothetical protein